MEYLEGTMDPRIFHIFIFHCAFQMCHTFLCWCINHVYFKFRTRQGSGQFNSGIGIAAQFQFQNWNWNWNWWNWKWNRNWKPQHPIVNQPSPNFSYNRGGHNLSCDWFLMQQECLRLGNCPPSPPIHPTPTPNPPFTPTPPHPTHPRPIHRTTHQPQPQPRCSHKTHGLSTFSPWVDRGIKNGDNIYHLTTMTQTKLLSMQNKWTIFGLGVKLSQQTIFNLILLIGIFRYVMLIHWDKYNGTLLINLMISPHCFG